MIFLFCLFPSVVTYRGMDKEAEAKRSTGLVAHWVVAPLGCSTLWYASDTWEPRLNGNWASPQGNSFLCD